MAEIVVRKLLQKVPVYCEDCNELHEFSLEQLRAIIWVLQAEAMDPVPPSGGPSEPDCLSVPLLG